MKHIDSSFGQGMDIGPMLNQELYNLHISMEGRKVQGCKSVISSARRIYPLLESLLSFLVIIPIAIGGIRRVFRLFLRIAEVL